MIIGPLRTEPTDYKMNSWEDEEYIIYWTGFLYWPDTTAGEASVIKVREQMKASHLGEASRKLRGNFLMVVQSKADKTIWAFTDYSGMFQAYYSPDGISPNYLALVKQRADSPLNLFGILNFLHLGHIYFERTHTKAIKKFSGNIMVKISSEGELSLIRRKPPQFDFSDKPIDDFLRFFSQSKTALQNETVNIDLTGGSDSRLVALLLNHLEVKFEASIYNYPDAATDKQEVKIARKAASMLDIDLHEISPAKSPDEAYAQTLFELGSGLADIKDLTGLHKVAHSKKEHKATLSVNGGAGAIYKDFWWLQDFPFYKRKSANYERLLKWRILQRPLPHSLSGSVTRSNYDLFKAAFLKNLWHFKKPINTQTYDRVLLRVIKQEMVGHSNRSEQQIITAYSPLLEYIPAKIGYNLPRYRRTFNLFQRQLASRLSVPLATLETNHFGNSLSAKPADMAKDIPLYLLGQAKNSVREFIKNKVGESNSEDNTLEQLRKTTVFKEAFVLLQEARLLSKGIALADVDNYFTGRIYTLGKALSNFKFKSLQ